MAFVYDIKTKEEFEKLISECQRLNRILLLDCYAQWCGPCKKIAPIISKMSIDPDYIEWAVFAKLDVEVEECEDIVRDLQVSAMPTFFIFYNSQEEEISYKPISRCVGADINVIRSMLHDSKSIIV